MPPPEDMPSDEHALDFRQLIKLAIRTLPYLKSVRKDLGRLAHAH